MLRCPTSRINLSSSDIVDFEQRHAARQYPHLPTVPSLRLSPSPGRRTDLVVVPEVQNVGHQICGWGSSQATICISNDEITTHSVSPPAGQCPTRLSEAGTSIGEPGRAPEVHALVVDAAQALQRMLALRTLPRPVSSDTTTSVISTVSSDRHTNFGEFGFASDPPYPQDSIHDEPAPAVFLDSTTGQQRQPLTGISLDGTRTPANTGGRGNLHPASTPQRRMPALFSSARARRRHTRSHDFQITEEVPEYQQWTEGWHHGQISTPHGPIVPVPLQVPELVVHESEPSDASLNPGAPAFVPRTRFGNATNSSTESTASVGLELRWNSLDSTHSFSNLRLRSLSEQNVDLPIRHRSRTGAQPRHRRPNTASDQNMPGPNLERYPVLRPSRLSTARHSSGSHRVAPVSSRHTSTSRVIANSGAAPTTQTLSDLSSTPSRGSVDVDEHSRISARGRHTQIHRIFSPPASVSLPSLSPTHRHHFHREPTASINRSPLSGNGSTLDGAPITARRRLSMVSAASGISNILSSRHSSTDGLSAAAEFLRMRGSPLDELTERLSRVAASRPRSVGRSWERPGGIGRVSLLHGNPFKIEGEPGGSTDESAAGLSSPSRTEESIDQLMTAGLAFPLPSISPPTRLVPTFSLSRDSSPGLSSTPPIIMQVHQVSSPRSPLADLSSRQSTAFSSLGPSSKVNAAAVVTPRVRVYDDAQPPDTQPQTPADVIRKARRGRIPSNATDSVSWSSPDGNSTAASPTPQHRAGRDVTSSEGSPQTSTQARTPGILYTARAEGSRGVAGIRAGDENELEIDLPGLDEDRRTWLERREVGSLDTTPPGEGRFERYLS